PIQDGLESFLPILNWGRRYTGGAFADDLLATTIVTIMLIPQSLAYALLAGLPPETGLYASIAPLIAYALFGTSRMLAVGPVAIISLMTASAVGRISAAGLADPATAAFMLAFLSGAMLFLLGLFRLGALANLLSQPVNSGFATASGVIIAASQIKNILGLRSSGDSLVDIIVSLGRQIAEINSLTAVIGLSATIFLWWARSALRPLLEKLGAPAKIARTIAKAGPVAAVALSILAVSAFSLQDKGVAVVGAIPQGLPPFTPPLLNAKLWAALAGPAALISIISFISSVSVAQALAAKHRERIDPDQELIGLGAANIASGLTGGFPVTGGFARSVINFDAGAATPAAGLFTAIGLLFAALYLTPLLHDLPNAVLAATIIVAVLSVVDVKAFFRTWRYSKSDAAAMAATIIGTLVFGVEMGLLAGVALSLALHIRRTSAPHYAIVGQVPGTEHFRNIYRHKVVTSPEIITLRLDESLYFANARYLEDRIYALVAANPAVKQFILMCPAVNAIDASGLESLEAINARLKDAGVTFHLSEVKGPVMDRLKRSQFLEHLTGRIFMTQFGALSLLDPERAKATLAAAPDLQFAINRGEAADAE
ncbi:MAG TPA: sulfate permease, partial [Parvularculaceae bacterium]|nr:sulfate permease [Parvularculaceae bacterium]